MGPTLGHIGPLFDQFWAPRAALGGHFGALRRPFRSLSGAYGLILDSLGGSWGHFRALVDVFGASGALWESPGASMGIHVGLFGTLFSIFDPCNGTCAL